MPGSESWAVSPEGLQRGSGLRPVICSGACPVPRARHDPLSHRLERPRPSRSHISAGRPGRPVPLPSLGARVSRVRPGRTDGALRCARQSGICLTFPFLGLGVGLELWATARGGGGFLPERSRRTPSRCYSAVAGGFVLLGFSF